MGKQLIVKRLAGLLSGHDWMPSPPPPKTTYREAKMAIETKIKLQPFRVPNFAICEVPAGRRQDGFKEAPKYALSELDDETLEELCRQFKDDVFAKARKAS